jgi:hypothetical protein
MKTSTVLALALSMGAVDADAKTGSQTGSLPREDVRAVSPALERYAAGQVEQIPYHLNRAMNNGLTREEASEAISHLAYYAGWPNAFSAAPVARAVFEKRAGN